MSLPRIDVVVLNYNTRDILAQCLPMVLKHSQHENVRVVLADNASTDDSLEFVKRTFGNQIHIIKLDQNYGFAGGYNEALKHCDAEYFVLLNSDAEPAHSEWLYELYATALEHTNFAAAQPKILDYKRNGKFEYAGAAGGFIDHYGFPFCKGRIFGNVEIDTHQYEQSEPIFWASGAAFFIKRDAWNLVNGLDPSFFAHMEEIDLCWRLQSIGGRVRCLTQSSVYHKGGGTLSSAHPRKSFLNFRNSLLVLIKNVAGPRIVFIILVRLILDGLSGIVFILQGRPKHTWAIIKAHFSVYRLLPIYLKKRKIWANRLKYARISSILYARFFKNRRYFSQL